uniref:PKS_DH domain-containing protein n=1 Tax=Heligmosomoides polygyrus TaxID=6339 RepID=A0A183GP00_HELPZ
LAKGSTEPRKAPSSQGKRQDHPSFYTQIELLGLTAEALVDTGFVAFIIPTVLLDKAKDRGIDIDGIIVEAVIEVDVNVKGARQAQVQLHVQESHDDFVILGTNAFEALGIQQHFYPKPEEGKSKLLTCVQPLNIDKKSVARALKRVVIQPNSEAIVELQGLGGVEGDRVFWSGNDGVASGVCRLSNGSGRVPVVNRDLEPWVILKGEVLAGEHFGTGSAKFGQAHVTRGSDQYLTKDCRQLSIELRIVIYIT